MGILLVDCPYCGGAKMTFAVTAQTGTGGEPSRCYLFSTPENVGRVYKQAANAMNRGDWDAAGTMSRKALDIATRCLDKSDSFAKKKLALRIDDLETNRLITPQIKDWAHAIRIDGNDAAHDPDLFTEAEARVLFNFTDLFLQYIFTMPGMLEERQKSTVQPPAQIKNS